MEKERFTHSLEQTFSTAEIEVTTLNRLDDGTVQGNIQFRNGTISVKFDTEEESPSIADFDALIQLLKGFLSYFNESNYESFIHDTSFQVVSDIYQQSDITDETLKEECINLEKNMTLKSIEIYPDGFMLVYDINFDNELLHLQLDTDYAIEDIVID